MRSPTLDRSIVWLLGIAAIVLIAIQLSSLYVSPIHDSYLWWGDESWLMNEYRAQIATGVFRHPHAYGSSIFVGNPFPFSAMWVTSGLYGIASSIFSQSNLVDVGRTVTACIAAFTLVALYLAGRLSQASSISVVVATLILISTRSFFLTSHSARYDILTSLALLALLWLLIQVLSEEQSASDYLKLGALWGASLMISVHVPIMLFLPVCFFLYTQPGKWTAKSMLILGAAASISLLLIVHLLTQPSLGAENNLSENLSTLPILRPFSFSVQWSNLLQKWDLLISFAPQVLLLLIFCVEGLRCRDLSKLTKRKIILLMLPVVGWLFFQSAGPSSYLIHFLPALALAAAISIQSFLVGNWQKYLVTGCAIVSIGFGVRDALIAKEVGSELSRSNTVALVQIGHRIGDAPLIAMNSAQSFFSDHTRLATSHFIELPSKEARQLAGEGYLLAYNSALQAGFMWEVDPLRQEITDADEVLTGRFLDVGRSYFEELTDSKDTIFLQQIDLNALYTRHIR